MEERRNDVELKVLSERVTNWMETTTEYRKSLCVKLDIITERLNNLPCKVRIERTKNLVFQLRALWAVTGGMVLAILADWIRMR